MRRALASPTASQMEDKSLNKCGNQLTAQGGSHPFEAKRKSVKLLALSEFAE